MVLNELKKHFEWFNENQNRNMNDNTNTSFFFRDDELLYFSGDIYKPNSTIFHDNIWMVLTFLIQGIGVLMNSYLVSTLLITSEQI